MSKIILKALLPLNIEIRKIVTYALGIFVIDRLSSIVLNSPLSTDNALACGSGTINVSVNTTVSWAVYKSR